MFVFMGIPQLIKKVMRLFRLEGVLPPPSPTPITIFGGHFSLKKWNNQRFRCILCPNRSDTAVEWSPGCEGKFQNDPNQVEDSIPFLQCRNIRADQRNEWYYPDNIQKKSPLVLPCNMHVTIRPGKRNVRQCHNT
jgi:hypothetical protein